MSKDDVSFAIRAKDKTKAAFDACRASLNSLGKGFGVLSAAAIAAFAVIANKVLDSGDRIHKLSLKLGMSTEELSKLKHAADLSGVSFESMQKALQKMSEGVADAADDTGTANDAIKALGLNAETLKAMKPDEQFAAIADAMAGVASQGDKVRYATDIFGGRGVEMLQMMSGGAEGLEAMKNEAEALGMVLSQEGADSIANFNDAMTRVKGAITGTVQTIVTKAAPAFTKIFNYMAERIPDAAAIAGVKIQQWAGVLMEKFEDLAEWYEKNSDKVSEWATIAVDSFRLVGNAVKFVWTMFEGVGRAIGIAIAKVVEFFEWVSRTGPVDMIMRFFTMASPVRPFSEGLADIERRLSGFSGRVSGMKPNVTIGATMPAKTAEAGVGSRAPLGGGINVTVSPTFMTGDRNAARACAMDIKRELEALNFRMA